MKQAFWDDEESTSQESHRMKYITRYDDKMKDIESEIKALKTEKNAVEKELEVRVYDLRNTGESPSPRLQKDIDKLEKNISKRYDAIIVGTGQSGPALAGRLNREGLKTAVIERKLLGGTCVNVGCIPTKTLVASARAAYMARRGADFGVRIEGE